MKFLLAIAFCVFTQTGFCENKNIQVFFLDSTQQIVDTGIVSMEAFQDAASGQPNPVFKLFKKKHRLNKKITAAVLAFPFPFGIVGLHRIYLGTKPYVPVAYIASLGGVFGILPFIDFCAITLDKDFDYYKNNGKVFMWVRD